MNRIPTDEGGDAYLVNGNMISITTAMKNTRPVAAGDGSAQARRRKTKGGPRKNE
jgi:hypothetical protein